ncbi:hypothetical protein Sjap_021827 [Stephania japonica]|uniref:Uncharacterized protein n=1 Tax=Stephania japonica TaxID=461633 RepID=A0AAP0HUG9_9MAGN
MKLTQVVMGIKGMISGSECLDSSRLSSSVAVGVAYLLALESANGLTVLPDVNIELDRLIENEYLGLKMAFWINQLYFFQATGVLLG